MFHRFSPMAVAALGITGIFAAPAFAAAQTGETVITVPVSGVHRGAEGSTLTIASVAVPTEAVGLTCNVVGQTRNQRSVHPGNDLLITTGGQTFVIPDFEDEGDIVHEAGVTEALGSTIEIAIRFGPDRVSSGGFSVSVACEPAVEEPVAAEPVIDETTTTTEAAPATTEGEEEVDEAPTVPSTTATDPEGPTVAAAPPATTPDVSTTAETAEVPATAPSTTAATDLVERPQTTTTQPAAAQTEQLPVTGSSTVLILAAGAILTASGAAALGLSARSKAAAR